MRKYIVPTLKEDAQLHRLCPRCHALTSRIQQHRLLTVTHTDIATVRKLRLRCPTRRLTWTCQPEGLKPHFQRSQRIRALNLLLYALGLSYQTTATVITSLGAPEPAVSVYRDLLDSMGKVKALHLSGFARLRGWMYERGERIESGGLL